MLGEKTLGNHQRIDVVDVKFDFEATIVAF